MSATVYPPPPFDYGDAVEWVTGNGQRLAGSIYGFIIERQIAQIELPDGTDVEAPLAALTILK